MRAEIDPKHKIDNDLRKQMLQMLMGEQINLLAPRYYVLDKDMLQGIQRIKKMTLVDFANEDNYDIAVNDASLGGECALEKFAPAEAKKAYKRLQSKEIDTDDLKSKYLLSKFWRKK